MNAPLPRPVVPVAAEEVDLYEIRKKIYPRAVHGDFARARWAMVFLTQAVFYGLPWLSWNDRPAVLFDLAARRFYVFGWVFWPQDVIYLTLLLILCALSLFLFTAIAGRLWCGYACPQTVYTEIFLWIERHIEGDRLARIRLDAAPVSARKLALKGTKHLVWVAVALWTGYTFVGYFTPIHELASRALSLDLGHWESFWILFYGFATYGNAGFMREQVCKYMCPYARFQGVMFDRDTLVITYDSERGEPRGSRSRSVNPREKGLGDCVDCGICVQVCPTGIDIRKGLQYECIGCAACVDGCDQVMEKMNYPKGLIRYTTENALSQHFDRRAILRRVLRPRSLAYGAILILIAGATTASLATRNPLRVDVIRDRGALAREAGPGVLENVFRIQIMNTDEKPRSFAIEAAGLTGLAVVGIEQPVAVGPAASRLVALRLTAPLNAPGATAALAPGTHKIEFIVRAIDDDKVIRHELSSFIVPR